jgi:hypothetical protein
MSLEQELVSQMMNDGNSEEDVLNVVRLMEDPTISSTNPLKLNSDKIQRAIRAYTLQRDYRSPANSKKSIKGNLRERVKRLTEERIKGIKESDERITSIGSGIRKAPKKQETGSILSTEDEYLQCTECSGISLKEVYSQGEYLSRLQNGVVVKKVFELPLFYFCKDCGSIFNFKDIGRDKILNLYKEDISPK